MNEVLLMILMGLCGGILSGLMGVGGGVVLVPLMLFGLSLPQHLAQGISMLVIIPTAIVAIMRLRNDCPVNYRVAIFLAIGAVIGSLISSQFVQSMDSVTLRNIFGVFIIITGLRMIIGQNNATKKQ